MGMGIDSHLIHTCDVQRPTSSRDGYNVAKKTWGTHIEGQHCRLVVKTQRNPLGALAENPYITTYLALMPAGTDVKPGDRLANVVFEDGETDAGPYRIEAILTRRGRGACHISLQLEKV